MEKEIDLQETAESAGGHVEDSRRPSTWSVTRRRLFQIAAGAGMLAAIPSFPAKAAKERGSDGDAALAAVIEKALADFIASRENTLKMPEAEGFEHCYEKALVGYVRGDDPLIKTYKTYVGPFHMTPLELFNKAFPGVTCKEEELSVISWVMPFVEKIRREQRLLPDVYPSRLWGKGRVYGEMASDVSRRKVVELLAAKGYYAVSASISEYFKATSVSAFGFASTWSERHYAHAAGLGTFGLCDGLITRAGKAHRVASAVVKASLPATPRPYNNHRAWCLYFTSGGKECGLCADHCPPHAITKYTQGLPGKDKTRCFNYVSQVVTPYVKANYDNGTYTIYCGRCQVNVPCEDCIPPGIIT